VNSNYDPYVPGRPPQRTVRHQDPAEEYADYGPLHQFYSTREQSHQMYAVIDHTTKLLNLEVGVGFGLTSSSDKVTLKLMVSRDLN